MIGEEARISLDAKSEQWKRAEVLECYSLWLEFLDFHRMKFRDQVGN